MLPNVNLRPPQELPLYKTELEIYFSPGRVWTASLALLSHLSYTLPTPPPPQLIYLTLTPVFVTQLPGHFAHGSDRHMIRLEDIFQKFPRIPAIVEIKEKNEELIHKVVLKPGR